MFKLLVVLGILLVVVALGSSATELTQNVEIKVVSTEEMKLILKQFPNAIELQRKLQPRTLSEEKVGLTYYLGKRVKGDFRVGHNTQNLSWKSPTNVKMTVDYPKSGVGRIVSYVEILVEQSTMDGKAYVTRGGIGQRFITVIIEAYNTYIFNEESSIYGY